MVTTGRANDIIGSCGNPECRDDDQYRQDGSDRRSAARRHRQEIARDTVIGMRGEIVMMLGNRIQLNAEQRDDAPPQHALSTRRGGAVPDR